MSLSLLRLEIIKRLEKGENRNVLMNEFNIGSSILYDIKKQKDYLMRFAGQSVTANKLASRQLLKKPKLEELDSMLYNWFSVKRAEGKPLTGPMITEKAKKFKADLNVYIDTFCSLLATFQKAGCETLNQGMVFASLM